MPRNLCILKRERKTYKKGKMEINDNGPEGETEAKRKSRWGASRH